MANLAITSSFPAAAASVGLVPTYAFYAIAALISFFFVRAMVQETRGRELEQMTG
jgi:SP family sugar:H+ symporter-like MFS transporter